MIDMRAREATRSALLELAAIELPDAETVIARRRARHRARVGRVSAAIVVLLTLISGLAVVATRERSTGHVATSHITPETTPAGLSLKGSHARACHTELFQAVYGCNWETNAGASSDIAAVSVRDTRANGWVVDLTLTPAAATRFAQDTILSASVDGVAINVARGEHGMLVLAGAGTDSWDAKTANAVAARVVETR